MAFPLAAFFLTYLLSASATDQLNVSVSAVQKLVDYRYALDGGEMLPGIPYSNSVIITWAINDSALRGLDGRTVIIKTTASAQNGSDVYFISPIGLQEKTGEAYLQCAVQNGTCSNSSNLTAQMPFVISVNESAAQDAIISLESRIVGSQQLAGSAEIQKTASGLFDSFKNAFSQNESGQQTSAAANASQHGNSSNSSGSGNFLDSLKPEGDSKNPLEFLRANPIISIAALAIVIIITGAYLINAKD